MAVFVKLDASQNPGTGRWHTGKDERKRKFIQEKYDTAVAYSRSVHANYLREFGLTAAQTPLLEYSPVEWLEADGSKEVSLPFRELLPA
jgi:hypothetical protein